MLRDDYRKNIGIIMKIMSDGRRKIYEDIDRRYSNIFDGLHEYSSDNVRDLYFQSYFMEWLDWHWCDLSKVIKDDYLQITKNEEKNLTLFFANYFSSFVSEISDSSTLAQVSSRELLSAKKEIINNMIEYSSDWEERNNQLKVDLKKHKEHFRRLIEKAKSNQEG